MVHGELQSNDNLPDQERGLIAHLGEIEALFQPDANGSARFGQEGRLAEPRWPTATQV